MRDAATWVYVQQGEVCGFISVHPRHHVAGLFVEPECQGRGIGSRLLAHVHDIVELESVDVYSLNLPARQFYERQGFQISETFSADADGAPYALLRMTRSSTNQCDPTAYTRNLP